ncbi:serine O-acetyltransferase [Stieleria varia]|uniref:Serine acetyltransferase n=1 Tax=Stieleria varia TaxID=2528005 RepID=A0A5C6AHH0_9BACT|nr:serine acetyltransferase [Stieleria varia]TWT98625.1 Serine acetyltransferase [Stieleria varia]
MNPTVICYRIGNWFHRHGMRRIGWVITWINRLIFGGFVPSSASLGKSIVIGYWGLGVVLHKDCVIGDYCHIGTNVTVGRNPGQPGVPKIGDHVYIATGAVVSGSICIGSRVIIGANSVVLSDLPDGVLAVGSPAKVVRELTQYELETVLSGIVP